MKLLFSKHIFWISNTNKTVLYHFLNDPEYPSTISTKVFANFQDLKTYLQINNWGENKAVDSIQL